MRQPRWMTIVGALALLVLLWIIGVLVLGR
jgi:hypothetical protein